MDYLENNNSLLLCMQSMEKFVNGIIDGTQFDREFCRIWRVSRDKEYSLKELPDKIEEEKLTVFEGFSYLINDLFTDCDVFKPDSALKEDYEISEEELRNCVEKDLLEIKYRYL
tara:strand:- start:4832 stop:5173 length:342 start_codon:yes stop_codon:yes gene_type:complete